MKKIVCYFVFGVLFYSTLHAQLIVSETGNVGIGLEDSISPLSLLSINKKGQYQSGMYIEMSSPYGSQYTDWINIFSKVNATSTPSWNYSFNGQTLGNLEADRIVGVQGMAIKTEQSNNGRSYGVIGIAGMGTSGWNFGVSGYLRTDSDYGAGIYGGLTYGSGANAPGRYAGFFNGQTKVNGNLYATSFITTSDARLKNNISDIGSATLQKVFTLRPIQFNWREVENKCIADTADRKTMYLREDMDYKRLHYGFLAQEVQKLYPELVHGDGDGYLSVNYIELIPILVQAIQELSKEVEELKKENGNNDRYK